MQDHTPNTFCSILLVTTSYPLAVTSISGIFVQQLAIALHKHADVTVLTPADHQVRLNHPPGPPVYTFRYAPRAMQVLAHGSGGIPVALATHRARAGLIPFFLGSMMLACIIQGRRHAVLCANWSISGIVAGLAGKLIKRPVVTVLRGEDANRATRRGLYRLLLGFCLRWSHRVVTVSDAIADRLRTSFPGYADKIRLIPNGVSDMFLDIPMEISHADRTRLLFVGSLIPRKSVGTLIEAMTYLPNSFSLTIVGDGPEARCLRMKSEELGVDHKIRFQGQCTHTAMPGVFSSCDIVLLPSLGEGRANIVLEAFAAAKPVIATDIDGNREMIGCDERGMLFPPTDARTLAACILAMSKAATYNRTAAAARRFIIEEGLTWAQCARKYYELIQELCPQKRCAE